MELFPHARWLDTTVNSNAWLRAGRRRLALPIRGGDLGDLVKLLQASTLEAVLEEKFVFHNSKLCWMYIAMYGCNTLHGQQVPLAMWAWSSAERRAAEAIEMSVDRALAHSADINVDAQAVEKDVKLARVSYSGEEVGSVP